MVFYLLLLLLLFLNSDIYYRGEGVTDPRGPPVPVKKEKLWVGEGRWDEWTPCLCFHFPNDLQTVSTHSGSHAVLLLGAVRHLQPTGFSWVFICELWQKTSHLETGYLVKSCLEFCHSVSFCFWEITEILWASACSPVTRGPGESCVLLLRKGLRL